MGMSAQRQLLERVPETGDGLQDACIAEKYDSMQRHIRDSGWLAEKVDCLLANGLDSGEALEIGMGPGYLGLEWLQAVSADAVLTGLDLSPEMVALAESNRQEYGLTERASYGLGNALRLPFAAESFDCAFSYGSLHEWTDPVLVFDEIHRVLRSGGRYCVIDLRRDLDRQAIRFMRINIDSEMRAGFMRSVRASYVREELEELLSQTRLSNSQVTEIDLGILVSGTI